MTPQQSVGNIDALILCGGLGTRLRSVIGAKQKTVAEVNGRPFLFFIIEELVRQGVRRVILSSGYQAEELRQLVVGHDFGATVVFSVEAEPLGTGGALRFAQSLIQSDPFFVLNGDSFCQVRYADLLAQHQERQALATLTLVARRDREDYGSVVLTADGRVQGFLEKAKDVVPAQDVSGTEPRFVNAGVYCFSRGVFAQMPSQKKFSLEYDFFPRGCGQGLAGFVVDGPFIDIGTPERYAQAQKFFR